MPSAALLVAHQCSVGLVHGECAGQLNALFAHELIQCIQRCCVITTGRAQGKVPAAAVFRTEKYNGDLIFARHRAPHTTCDRAGERPCGGVVRGQHDNCRRPGIHAVGQVIGSSTNILTAHHYLRIMKQTHIHVQVRVFRVISKGLAIAQTHSCGLAIYGSVQISVGLVQLCRSQSRGCHSGYGSTQRGSGGKLHKIAAFHSVFSFL